jgi:anhydro-N-acetylmuramic acid kinase
MSSKAPPALFIGLMTGTSLDGIDAVIANISDNHFTLVSTLSQPIPESLRGEILGLCQPGNNEIDRAGAVSLQLAEHYANTCQTLLDRSSPPTRCRLQRAAGLPRHPRCENGHRRG